MPSKSLFLEEEEPATASVVLKVRRGSHLSEDQVQGIVHLVSSSVSGLMPENVTVVNNNGKMLAGFKNSSKVGQVSSDQFEFQEKIEKTLEDRVRTMLETALGSGKAVARVSCLIDFTRLETTEEKYQTDNQVVRSEQVLSETSTGQGNLAMGVPGVVSNLSEGETGATEIKQTPLFQKQDRTVNYEIGKVINRTVEPVGTMKKVSVAVIVDGTYKTEKGASRKEELKYFPRTQEEMTKLEDIVKRAVNFDAARGDMIEVVNIPFETAKIRFEQRKEVIEDEDWLSVVKQYSSYIKYGFLVIFVFFSFIFIVRPLISG